ncbi:MAG: hypothetical protein J6A37_05840 [Oscillospiraceae bacterium]|nr:hypothetical protein [Oscillospiraceae bacterium]
MTDKSYTTITIEVDDDLYKAFSEICKQNNTTPEIVFQEFVEFSATPENRQTIIKWCEKCREDGLV